MIVDIQVAVPGPPDVRVFPPWLHPVGEWVRYSTEHAHAYCFEGRDKTGHTSYLLHWIESSAPGSHEASAIMAAIGIRGDQRRASGTLVCEPGLVGWYHRFGWVKLDDFDGYAVLVRHYVPMALSGDHT